MSDLNTNALNADIEELSDDISDVNWLDAPVLIIFWVLFSIVLLQFFTRYVLNDSLGWTEEIARYLLIFTTFIGAVTCVRKGSHIALEFFYRFLPKYWLKPLTLFTEGLVVIFWSWAGYLCIGLARSTRTQMVSIGVPKSLIYWIVVIGCFGMALMAIVNIVQRFRKSSDDVADELLGLEA